MSAAIDAIVADARWRRRIPGATREVRRAARAALAAAGAPPGCALAVLLADDARLHALNRAFRRRDKPTNVLSFPDGAARPGGAVALGDVALAFETCAAEARDQRKTLRAHMLHLVVHGVLHLLGHDHARAREASRMEALEREVLAGLGVADPYAAEGRAA